MTIESAGASKDFQRSKTTPVFTAVEPVDLRLEPSSLTVITGRSGSGKSTLLNMFAGLLAPTRGSILLDGVDLALLDEPRLSRLRNEHIGLVPQGHTALRSLSVVENVLLPSILYHEADEQRAGVLLDEVGIGKLAQAKPQELSGGELRRMAVARALIMSPDIVLADEPTSGLDDDNAVAVLSLLRRTADEGAAVLVVSHDDEARGFADRVLVMDSGRLGE